MGDDESMSQTEEVVQSEPTVAEKSENQEQSKEAEGDETLVEKEQVAEEVEVDEGKTKEERQARAAMLKEKGNAKFRSKEYYAAIDFYNQAIEEDPEDGTYYNNRAAAEMAMGFTDKAVESCTKCLELDDGNLKAMIRLGKCYLRLGKAEDALAWFKKALEKDPGNNAVFEEKKQAEILQQRIQRAQEALRDGDFQHALAFAQAGLRQAPDCRELSIIRARGLIASGDYDQAYSLTTKLMRENQNDSELLLYRAKCLYYQENFANAIRHLQNALQLDPDNKEAQNEIRKIRKLERLKETGNVAFKSGRMQEAIDSYSACMEIDPENKLFSSKLYCNRATARQKLKQHEEALEDAEKAIALNPDYGKAYMRKAACLRAIGGKENIEQALHCYSRAEELMGRSAQLNQDVRDTKVELKKAKRKDYYKILDLEKKESSTEAEIKKAYKKKALQWHPDRHAGKTEEEQKKAEAAFKDVGEAYEVLSNPEKRQKYDAGQTLEEIEQGMPNMGHHDPNEIFQMFFGGGMGGGGGFRRGGGGFGGGHPGFGGAYGGAHRGYHDAY